MSNGQDNSGTEFDIIYDIRPQAHHTMKWFKKGKMRFADGQIEISGKGMSAALAGAPLGLLGIAVAHVASTRRADLVIDPAKGRALWDSKKPHFSLQLGRESWLIMRTKNFEEHDSMLNELRRVYDSRISASSLDKMAPHQIVCIVIALILLLFVLIALSAE